MALFLTTQLVKHFPFTLNINQLVINHGTFIKRIRVFE